MLVILALALAHAPVHKLTPEQQAQKAELQAMAREAKKAADEVKQERNKFYNK